MPVGTAISIVVIMIGMRSHGGMPATNMWCAQTEKPSTPIEIVENATRAVAEDRLARHHRR